MKFIETLAPKKCGIFAAFRPKKVGWAHLLYLLCRLTAQPPHFWKHSVIPAEVWRVYVSVNFKHYLPPGNLRATFQNLSNPTIQVSFLSHAWPWASPGPFNCYKFYTCTPQDLKALSKDPFLRIQFLLVPKNWLCEHIKNDLPSNGSVILKKTGWKKNMVYFHPTFSLKHGKAVTNFAGSFWRQIEDSLLVLRNELCEHTTNDLLTFSPQKQNLEIGLSERLLPVFRIKN